MNRLIITCQCKDMPKFAADAFPLLFPGELVPRIVSGPAKIYYEADKYPNTSLAENLKAMAKNKERFAYFVEHDSSSIKQMWDLNKGFRVC